MAITITGKVRNDQGNPIIGASVYVYQSDTATLVASTTSDSNGLFSASPADYAAGYDVKIVWGTRVEWRYVADKMQGQNVVVSGTVTVRDWANANDLTKIDGGKLYVGSLIELASSGSIRSGQTAYNTGTGWWIGDVAGTPKMSLGVAGGAGFTWDGVAFSVSGAITSTSGTIGGWTLGATTLTGGLVTLSSAGWADFGTAPDAFVSLDGRAGSTYRLWAGGDGFGVNAPFSVTGAGALKATLATITGAITASSGSITGPLTMSGASASIAIGIVPPSSATVGTGLWLDRTGLYGLAANVQQFYVQASDGKAYFAGGAAVIDSDAIKLGGTVASSTHLGWYSGATKYGHLTMYRTAGTSNILAASSFSAASGEYGQVELVAYGNGVSTSYNRMRIRHTSGTGGTFVLENYNISWNAILEWDFATGNLTNYLDISAGGYIYPGPGVGGGAQATRYLYDAGATSGLAVGGGHFSLAGRLYPGSATPGALQTARYLYDDGGRIRIGPAGTWLRSTNIHVDTGVFLAGDDGDAYSRLARWATTASSFTHNAYVSGAFWKPDVGAVTPNERGYGILQFNESGKYGRFQVWLGQVTGTGSFTPTLTLTVTKDGYIYPGNQATGYITANASGNLALMGGNVGINVASPTNRLQVLGADNIWAGQFRGTSTTNQSYGIDIWAGTSANDVALLVRDYTADIEFMRITGNGNVGIGLTPTYQLQLSLNSAGKPTSEHWTIVSDRRLKENIAPFTDGIEVLRQINPVSYDLNGKAGYPAKLHGIGVIAQDVRPFLPYCVGSFTRDGVEYDDFNGQGLTYVMLNSIKGLDSQYADALARITQLETELAQLRARLN